MLLQSTYRKIETSQASLTTPSEVAQQVLSSIKEKVTRIEDSIKQRGF
jgi:hypothetical protein